MTTASSRERAAPCDVPGELPGPRAAPPVLVRPLRRDVEREVNYVRSSWSHAATKDRPAKVWFDKASKPVRVERMDEHTFFEAHVRRLVPRLLARSVVLVAEPQATPGILAGWLAFEPARQVIEPSFAQPAIARPLVVHFVYVSNELRGHGVASLLARSLPPGAVSYSHWSPKIENLAAPRGWTFDETRKWD